MCQYEILNTYFDVVLIIESKIELIELVFEKNESHFFLQLHRRDVNCVVNAK